MRKISKISLVAAVAVAGFSTANAQPLEQAIKDVDVSGSVVYRYDNFHSKNITAGANQPAVASRDTDTNRYKVALNLSSKVNDYVKFNSRFIVGGADNGFASLNAKSSHYATANNVGGANQTTGRSGGDGNADVALSNAYFALTAIPNTVVNIGKQGLTTPYTVAVDANGNEQNGTGILALTNVGPVTFGAGYFNNSNLDTGTTDINGSYRINGANLYTFNGSTSGLRNGATPIFDGGKDIYVATVQGDLDFVKLEAWYLGLQDTFGSYTLAATSNLDLAENAKLGLEARYVNLELNDRFSAPGVKPLETDNSMFRFAVDGKFSIVNARLAYTKTGKDGGLTAVDQDAKNTSLGWAITSNGVADADYIQAALGADILSNLNFTLNYGKLKADNQANAPILAAAQANLVSLDNIKQEEVYGQLTYKMSKNLTTYLRYGTYEAKTVSTGAKTIDETRGRIQVAYTF
ncbi:major outer membrane protein [Arcobacter cryaerophilus gv. pseudocryaerophilus]|uniref:Major outer membrane protein n=3 Tax=Arcobacteraceae TaxID=2808963 RepID=A0AA96IKH7_9BACT|nr:major outer membrane protein [Arcobacter sp. AZ-2023]WNL35629.1 major outer membrane protein [Arcobacter sp. AZ-2023]WPD11345.1 major outer membrane protein [Arcobacter sp. DSM 115960]